VPRTVLQLPRLRDPRFTNQAEEEVSYIVIVAGDVFKRFMSSHEYFQPMEHLGYVTMSEEAFAVLPLWVSKTLIPLQPEPLVYLYIAGSA
jgi:hypothetical protein